MSVLFVFILFKNEELVSPLHLSDGGKLRLSLPRSEGFVAFELHRLEGTDSISRGPHKVKAALRSKCENPRLSLRLVGSSIVNVILQKDGGVWRGEFTFALPGAYQVDLNWHGANCAISQDHDPLTIVAVDRPVLDSPPFIQGSDLFEDSAWISTRTDRDPSDLPDYIWANPGTSFNSEDIVRTSDSLVSKTGTIRAPNNFYRFSELGNYELLW